MKEIIPNYRVIIEVLPLVINMNMTQKIAVAVWKTYISIRIMCYFSSDHLIFRGRELIKSFCKCNQKERCHTCIIILCKSHDLLLLKLHLKPISPSDNTSSEGDLLVSSPGREARFQIVLFFNFYNLHFSLRHTGFLQRLFSLLLALFVNDVDD